MANNIYWIETDSGYKYFKIDGNYIKENETDSYYLKLKPNTFKYRENDKNYVIVDAGYYEKYDQNFNPIKDDAGDTETEYLVTKSIRIKPNVDRFVLYTYTRITKEKTNIMDDFKDREKEYVDVYPMYVDEFGNVQYMPLGEDVTYNEKPTPLDSEWHKGDVYEVIYKPSTFNLYKVRYNSYYRVRLLDYTKLNDTTRYLGTNQPLSDVFFTTIRSDWID